MTELWLIRHGESLGNVDGSQGDTALSPRGEEQARALATVLSAERFELVLASPLLRARQTAELALPGAPIVIEPRLRDLVVPTKGFVDTLALGPDGLRALLDQVRSDDKASEAGVEFMARVRSWLAVLPRKGPIVAFSHFAVVRECLRQLQPGPAPQTIDHCSILRAELR